MSITNLHSSLTPRGASFNSFTANIARTLYPHPLFWALGLAVFATNALWLAFSDLLDLNLFKYLTYPNNFTLVAVLISVGFSAKWATHPLAKYFVGLIGLQFVYLNLRIFNFLCFSFKLPWADEMLIRWSDAIAPPWLGYAEWVMSNPTVLSAMELCYLRVEAPMIMLFVVFCFMKLNRSQSGFLFSTAIAAIVCTLVSLFFPAKSAIETIAPLALIQALPEGTGVYQIEIIEALQSTAGYSINVWELSGLSTFPSFHTALGVLLIFWSWRAHWSVGLGTSIYSIIMIAATPVLGGHYFIDLVAGAIVGIVCAMIALPILDRWSHRLIAVPTRT